MRNKILVQVIAGLFFWIPLAVLSQERPASRYVDSALTLPDALQVNCGFDMMLKELRKSVDFVERERKMNEAIQKHVNGVNDPIVTLPVVFHIVNPDPSTVTNQQIIDALKDLNDAFSKSGNYASSTGADTRIQFVLAKRDSLGGITTGINRVTSFYGTDMNMNNEDDRMKNLIQWDPKRYINIWLVKNIVGEITANFSCGIWTRTRVGGYATLPTGNTSGRDGVVVPNCGVVRAHEKGHYLGLYHTFEGGCTNNNCTTDGDKVCDTPPDGSQSSSTSCDKPSNTCTTDTLSNYSNGFFNKDVPDPIANFMDYGNTPCSNQFTQGQADRMRAAIQTLRPGLWPNGGPSDAISSPCSETISALFTRTSQPYPKTGETVTFTANSGLANYQWSINNVIQAGNSSSFSYTFPSANKYKVSLKAFNNAGCFSTYTDYVIVTCGVTARFFDNKRNIASKTGIMVDTILFKNDSYAPSGTTYQWTSIYTPFNSSISSTQTITSNAAGANPEDLNYVFPAPGNYIIKLTATNGTCSDNTQDFFFVQDPTQDAFISITNTNCYQETKVRVGFYICNFGYADIPAGTPVTFYDGDPSLPSTKQIDQVFNIPDIIKGYCCGVVYTQILNVGYRNLNQLYAVVNDKAVAIPINLPNTTLAEKDYKNNIASAKDFRFRVVPNVTAATLEPGDTLQLVTQTLPDFNSTYAWNTAAGLSCNKCSSPFLYADTNITKQVIATSQYQCFDTAYIAIKVPPANDYTVVINSISCAGADSLQVAFTVANSFKRGILPKKLRVAFYNSDPSQASAALLNPVYVLPDSVQSKQKSYTTKIKKTLPGLVYAVVNDTANQVPVQLPNTSFPEKNYTNNTTSFQYKPVTKVIDTAICNGDTLLGHATTGSYSDLFTTTGGCDSVRVLNLTIKSVAVTRIVTNVTICQGESYAGYTTAGTYINVFKGVNSCDSIRTLNLTINPVARKTVNAQICKGFTYLAGGKQQTQSGTYIDSLKTSLGCDSIVTTVLQVNPLPAFFLPIDSVVCIGKTLLINLSGYNSVSWTTGVSDKVFDISSAGIYGATVTDSKGCVGTDSIKVNFQRCIPIQVPDGFTPNGDGKNDYFRPLIGAQISNYRMQIWSRWGQLVFETKEIGKGWNGKYNGEVQPNGAYIYFFSFVDPDGVPVVKKGTFVLIR